jgi:photosystem II stability/assembly factor-like uncharacterized protein
MMRSKGVIVFVMVALCLMLMNAALVVPVLGQNLSTRSDDPTDPLINQGSKKEAIGKKVMVSTMVPCVTEAAVDVRAQKIPDNIIKKFHYRSIEPTRQGGRIVDFAVPAQQSYTFYVATGSGGLWKTENNGLTYTPIFDHEHSIAIGDIEVAPSDPNIVWVGTGEANGDYWGDGMYKSIDAGSTWTNMGLRESHYTGRIRIHPKNPDIVYVAATGHYNSQNPERGIYKTTDGGKTWEKSLDVIKDGRYIGAIDLAMDPRNPDVLYAASYDRPGGGRHNDRMSENSSGIYKTEDGGASWTLLTNGLPMEDVGRIGLDIYLNDPDILYAVMHVIEPSAGDSQNRVYRTDDAGKSWRRLKQPRGEGLDGGSYFGQIRVDPNDENHLYVLSVQLYETKDRGKSWDLPFREERQKRHERVDYYDDHHAMWIDPANSNHMLLGTDHGMGITHNGGRNWYNPDVLPLAQLYAIGVDMDYPYNVYGGTQDNGNFRGPSTKKGRYPIRLEDWQYWGTGDGSFAQVDPSDTRWLYIESQYGEIERVDQRTGRRKFIQYSGNPNLRYNFNAPILISPHNPNVIFHGANVLLRSPFRGETWEEISPDLTKFDESNRIRERREKGTIVTIDESPVLPGIIWVGTDDGNVQITRDGGKSWEKLNDRIPGNPEHKVSRVTASYHNAGTAYISFTGRGRDDFRPYVYKTSDYGETWTSIASNLPDEPVNVIKEDHKNPNLLFLGDDKAVYVSIDGGEYWTRMKNNMPTQPVHDLVIHPRENDLVVGTYGRGFFITDISPLQELTPEVLKKEAHLFEIEPKVQWIIPREQMISSQNYAGENEPYGVMINYFLKRDLNTDVSIKVYQGERLIRTLKGTGSAGLNRAEWRMNSLRKRTEEEKKQWEGELEWYLVEPYTKFQQVSYHDVSFDPEDPDFIGIQVPPGEYTVKLTVNGKVMSRKAVILKDHWYTKYY